MLKLKRRFCSSPFIGLHVYERYYLCCPGWLRTPIGELTEDPLEVWNSPKAEEIRRSILNDKFNFCQNCPVLNKMYENKFELQYLDYKDGPRGLNLSHDRSCNLACPFCRTGMIQSKGAEFEKLKKIQDKLMDSFGNTLEQITITGAGDAFGSKLYYGLLKSMSSEKYPNLRITLCTNGLLVDRCWPEIKNIQPSIKEISVSVDAASENTYFLNRGAKWDVLLRNLKFISSLKRERDLVFVLRYCAQENNWQEMPDFVRLAIDLGADKVIFQLIQDLGTLGDYDRRAIQNEKHKDHAKFKEMLSDAIFTHPIVRTFNLKGCHDISDHPLS